MRTEESNDTVFVGYELVNFFHKCGHMPFIVSVSDHEDDDSSESYKIGLMTVKSTVVAFDQLLSGSCTLTEKRYVPGARLS